VIGGTFESVGGVPRNHLARLNPDGSLDLDFDPGQGANNAVLAVTEARNGKVFIGGSFTQYNGLARDRVARLNGDNILFNPVYSAGTFSVSTFTFPDQLYRLEFTDTVAATNWIVLPNVLGDGTDKTLTDPHAGPEARFYRMRTE